VHRRQVDLVGGYGPTWWGQTDHQTDFLTTVTDLPTMQPPLKAIKHRWIARQWDGRLANHPLGQPMPLPLHHLSSTYKYPYALYTL
jgi:hypothetical protein